jgi:hypothetical protein
VFQGLRELVRLKMGRARELMTAIQHGEQLIQEKGVTKIGICPLKWELGDDFGGIARVRWAVNGEFDPHR